MKHPARRPHSPSPRRFSSLWTDYSTSFFSHWHDLECFRGIQAPTLASRPRRVLKTPRREYSARVTNVIASALCKFLRYSSQKAPLRPKNRWINDNYVISRIQRAGCDGKQWAWAFEPGEEPTGGGEGEEAWWVEADLFSKLNVARWDLI